ncbi:hypothetical protein HDU93_002101 [Gonapodya sp. JEL0774]|nr:hypothetical protein HDU93_002101 [Gonapodya sp. JEL0774]
MSFQKATKFVAWTIVADGTWIELFPTQRGGEEAASKTSPLLIFAYVEIENGRESAREVGPSYKVEEEEMFETKLEDPYDNFSL